jgi:phage baseplate assembly protein W
MRKFKGYSTVGKTHGSFKTYDLELVKRDVLNELYTRKGERLMSPQFGSIVWDLLFDPMIETVLEMIRDDCLRIINKEPRLELLKVDVEESEHTVLVRLHLKYVPTATITELLATFSRNTATEITEG